MKQVTCIYVHARIMAVHIGKPWACSHVSVCVGIVVKCGKVDIIYRKPRAKIYISCFPRFSFCLGVEPGNEATINKITCRITVIIMHNVTYAGWAMLPIRYSRE